MYTTSLRRVGGSVMLTVPPALLEMLHLTVGSKIGLAMEGERLVLEPRPRPRYTLDELLAQCDESAALPPEDPQWLDAAPVGRELL